MISSVRSMRIGRFSITICLLLVIITLSQAQQTKSRSTQPAVPDLTGQWVLDRARSNLDKDIHDYSLDVIDHQSEIKFSKDYWRGKHEIKEVVVLHLDGRADIDPSLGVSGQSETRWQGQKLVRKVTNGLSPASGYPVNLQIVMFEEWVISTDRQTLTRTITRDGGDRLSKAVFTRVH